MSLRTYWTGDAIAHLFLRGPRYRILLGALGNCPVIRTAEASAGEFRLSVAKAQAAGQLMPGGGALLRQAFGAAVEKGRIVLIPAETIAAASPLDELSSEAARAHLSQLSPALLVHLAAARTARCGLVACVDENVGGLWKFWGLQPISSRKAATEEAIILHQERLARVFDQFTRLQECHDAISDELHQSKEEAEELRQHFLLAKQPQLAEAVGAVHQALDDLLNTFEDFDQTVIQETDDELGHWSDAVDCLVEL